MIASGGACGAAPLCAAGASLYTGAAGASLYTGGACGRLYADGDVPLHAGDIKNFILISPFIFFLKDDFIFYLFFYVTKQKTPNIGVLYSYLEEIKI